MTKKTPKTGKALEQRVASCYRAIARKVEHDVELAGHQIDVYVEMETADRSLHHIAVEAKDYTKPVGIKIVRDFADVVKTLRELKLVDEGVIVSAAGFSRQARNAAKEHGLRLLEPEDLEVIAKGPNIAQMRADYLASLHQRHAYLDLGGIAPKVANRTVKLPMGDIYVPVEAQRELDVQQTWQQLRDLLADKGFDLFTLPPSSIATLPPRLSDVDLEEITAKFADEGEPAARRIFQERLSGERPPREPASVKDILATPRAVLLGHPGTGKSTSLKYAAYAIAAGQSDLVGEEALGRLPILVRLVDYAKVNSEDPTLCLRDYVRDRHDKDRAPLFRQCLEDGQCLVMLDGLDEVIDPQQRAEIADQVEALVADCPGNHYLIASRIVGYEAGRLTGDFVHFTLGPLPESSIHGFVQKWYEAIEREGGVEFSEEAHARADELYQAIQERPGIRRLAENPLLLTIIALVNWKGRKLPNRRVEVYRHAAETLVESWPSRWREVTFDAEEVLSLLEPVAYRIFSDRSSEEIGQGELLPLLTQAVAEIKPGMTGEAAVKYATDLLPRLSEHSGLFLERGFDSESGEPIFGFLHLTFAEYLAARYLAGQWETEKDEKERRALLARYAHVPRWREVMLLLAQQIGLDGRRGPATQMLADLLQMETPYDDHLHRNLLLAGQCLADDLRVDPVASDWVLDRLAALMLETPIEPLREGIAALARQMAGTAYEGGLADRLLALLEDESADVRSIAAWALGRIGDERAVEDLLARLEDESEEVRAKAAWALGRIGDERAVEGLLARLEDESAAARYRAAEALGVSKSERAVGGLLARLGDENQKVCYRAARALGEIQSKWAVGELLARLEDESEAVRYSAMLALGAIKSKRAVESLLDRLEDESEAVRSSAAWALGEIQSEQVVEGLLDRLEDESEVVRSSAALALGQIKGEQAVEGLLDRLKDESEAVRSSAAEALGQIKSEGAVEGLLDRLKDESEAVRSSAAEALGQIKSERAVEGLLALLQDESKAVRSSAAEALGQIKSEGTVEGLLALLEDERADVRSSAAWALGAIQSEGTVEGLLARLQDESADVRSSAAWALGAIKSERAVEGLLALLQDERAAVRYSTTKALGAIKSEKAVEGLLALLQDESEPVRDSAAWALGAIKSERAVEGLLAWSSQTELRFFGSGFQRPCDWAYITVLEILTHHAADPGIVPSPTSQEPVVSGPWSKEQS